MDTILCEHVVSNWRIYGGENITLSVRFQNREADDTDQYCQAADDSAQALKHSVKSPIVQQYRRKSPGCVKRDINRLEARRQQVLNHFSTPLQGARVCDVNDTAETQSDKGLDSGIYHSVENNGNIFMTNEICESTVNQHTSTDELFISKESQTVTVDTSDLQIQVDTSVDKSSQTRRYATYFKTTQTRKQNDTIIQTEPVKTNDAFTEVEVEHPNNNKHTNTEPPQNKHVQTYIPKMTNRSALATIQMVKSTQTESTKKKAKAATVHGDCADDNQEDNQSSSDSDFLGLGDLDEEELQNFQSALMSIGDTLKSLHSNVECNKDPMT